MFKNRHSRPDEQGQQSSWIGTSGGSAKAVLEAMEDVKEEEREARDRRAERIEAEMAEGPRYRCAPDDEEARDPPPIRHGDVLSAAMRWPEVAERVAPLLADELVTAGPIQRRIALFVRDFCRRHDGVPKQGDWQSWVNLQPEQDRRATRDKVQKLLRRDLSGYTPGHVAEVAEESLRRAAWENARSRLRGISGPEGIEEAWREFQERIDSLIAFYGEQGPPVERTGAEILADPDSALKHPLLPKLPIYGGHGTAFYGAKTGGKSTFAAALAAAVTSGDAAFVGDPRVPEAGRVLWIVGGPGEETHVGVSNKVASFGGRMENLLVRDSWRRGPGRVLKDVASRVRELQDEADGLLLLVVDSLISISTAELGEPPKWSDTAGWMKIMSSLVELVRGTETALLAHHHLNREGGELGSVGIGIAADVEMTLKHPKAAAPNVRLVEANTGRTSSKEVPRQFFYHLAGDDADPNGGARLWRGRPDLSLRDKIEGVVRRNEPCSWSALRDAKLGRAETVREAALEMAAEGRLRDENEDADTDTWALVVPSE